MTNQDLLKIAAEYGTPTYVYDAESIKIQYEKLTSSFHKSTRFFYACKALSNINILKYVKNLGGSLDCVSINEVKLGLKAGFEPKKILFTPNCVDLAEIEEAMTLLAVVWVARAQSGAGLAGCVLGAATGAAVATAWRL